MNRPNPARHFLPAGETDQARVADIVLAADFSRGGDLGYRLAAEIRHLVGRGQRVLLLQIRAVGARDRIQPAIQACVERGEAEILPQTIGAEANRVILHEPSRAAPSALTRVLAGRPEVLLVCHTDDDLAANPLDDTYRARVRRYVTRAPLDAAGTDRHGIEDDLWLPPPAAPGQIQAPSKPTLAWLGDDRVPLPSRDIDRLCVRLDPAAEVPPSHVAIDVSDFSLDRIVSAADIFVAADAEETPPDTLVVAALAAGRRVILHESHRVHFGRGPIYFDKADPVEAIFEALRALDAGNPTPSAPDFLAACTSGPVTRVGRRKVRRAAPRPETVPRPVLYLPSNGIGVGHLNRLLAIARRLERPGVFASQVAAPGLIEAFGYAATYIPSAGWVGGDFDAWDAWYKTHIEQAIQAHDPAVVVYDGNHCSRGLVDAVAARPDCRLVWVRRGMWGESYSDDLANARWCDLVIEPGELAAERDTGVTAALRDTTHQVAPIRLFDENELLAREIAARAIGLDPDRPAVLVQLGSGQNRDLVSILDTIIEHLRRFDGVQIVVTEWLNGASPLNLWPDVTVLRGYPLSQYLRAFDFSVSAAGYNSFHELIGFGVPTVFIANTQPGMDDQGARAKFAQDHSAAFEISETELEDLPAVLETLMHPEARGYLSQHCEDLASENGALAAARAIEALI